MKNQSIKLISIFLLFLVVLTPLAFASELKLVKVSELKTGDVVVDKNGNEITVQNISTQAKKFIGIGQYINNLVYGNNPSKNNQLDVAVASGNSGPGTLITGNSIITGNIVYSALPEGTIYYQDASGKGGSDYAVTPNGKVFFNSGGSGWALESMTAEQFNSFADKNSYSQYDSAGTNYDYGKVGSGPEYTSTDDSPAYSNLGGGDSPSEMLRKSSAAPALAQAPDVSNRAISIQDELNTKYPDPANGEKGSYNGGDYTFDGQNWVADSGSKTSTTNPDLGYGAFGFTGAPGYVIQGAAWAVGVSTFVGVFGSFLNPDNPQETKALQAAVFAGVLAGRSVWGGLFGNQGGLFYNSVKDSPYTQWMTTGYAQVGVGALVAWITYNSQWSKTDTSIQRVSFQCMPWQAPHGGEDCELCNDESGLPCSEYRCKSLGQSCGIINSGTTSEMCVNLNPRDVSPPVIKPLESELTAGLIYSDVKDMPPGAGFKIKDTNTTTGCIAPFKPFTFGIQTNEPAQCKIDVKPQGNYSKMATYFGGDNLYTYNHTESLSLPSSADFQNSSVTLTNGKELVLYMRCVDASGNANEADYEAKLCVDPSPDTTAPVIQGSSITSGSCVAANTDNSTVEFYVNEPADCKWSFTDMDYKSMLYNMSCSNLVKNVGALQVYPCTAQLTGIARTGTDFYVRCQDQTELGNSTKRNTNMESYAYRLRGSDPLKLKNIQPNSTIYGAVRPAPVELYAETLFGCDQNQAVCFYSSTGQESSYVKFFDTSKSDGIHTQRLDLNDGTYTYYVKCVDSGGNLAANATQFKVEIDTNAPVIARVYQEDNYLKLVTPRNSECVYTNTNCDYLFAEGTIMPYANTTAHITDWASDKTYYIKCRDAFRSEPTDCSMIVRPQENFL